MYCGATLRLCFCLKVCVCVGALACAHSHAHVCVCVSFCLVNLFDCILESCQVISNFSHVGAS